MPSNKKKNHLSFGISGDSGSDGNTMSSGSTGSTNSNHIYQLSIINCQLSRQRELEAYSEVVGGGGVGVCGEQRRVRLPVVEEAHGEQFRDGIVCEE